MVYVGDMLEVAGNLGVLAQLRRTKCFVALPALRMPPLLSSARASLGASEFGPQR